ncbi:hypothetical protein [Pontibacterium sp.]|uniref:phosphorylase family protein n=1 Tax=Pontibacterium sp. TaxID=2036026 RepID=UPI003517520A
MKLNFPLLKNTTAVLLAFSITGIAQAEEAKRYLIVAALEAETPGLQQYAPIVYTGVGKVNAAIGLYEAINKYQPDLVINYGTAGAVTDVRGLNKIGTFIERDMDAREIGFQRGIAPFSGETLPDAKGVVLGTGDSFVSDSAKALEGLDIQVDLVDMEGYALWKVSQKLGVQFVSYKYISDDADVDAPNDWETNVANGAKKFAQVLEKDYGKSALLGE